MRIDSRLVDDVAREQRQERRADPGADVRERRRSAVDLDTHVGAERSESLHHSHASQVNEQVARVRRGHAAYYAPLDGVCCVERTFFAA